MIQHFGLTVGAFTAGLSRIGTTMVFQIQFAVPRRQAIAVELQAIKEALGAALTQARQTGMVARPFSPFQHLDGRPTAAITPAEGREYFLMPIFLLVLIPRPDQFLRRQIGVIRGATKGRIAAGGQEIG